MFWSRQVPTVCIMIAIQAFLFLWPVPCELVNKTGTWLPPNCNYSTSQVASVCSFFSVHSNSFRLSLSSLSLSLSLSPKWAQISRYPYNISDNSLLIPANFNYSPSLSHRVRANGSGRTNVLVDDHQMKQSSCWLPKWFEMAQPWQPSPAHQRDTKLRPRAYMNSHSAMERNQEHQCVCVCALLLTIWRERERMKEIIWCLKQNKVKMLHVEIMHTLDVKNAGCTCTFEDLVLISEQCLQPSIFFLELTQQSTVK